MGEPGAVSDPGIAPVRIGRLGRVHGVKGEIALEGSPFDAAELNGIGRFLWRGREGAERTLTLTVARDVHRGVLLAFTEISDREAAVAIAGGELFAERGRLPDPGPEMAYTFELVGLEVRDQGDRRLGTLAEIWNTGAHPIYVVRGEREWLIPAHPGVLQEVDRDAGVIRVILPAGLEDI